MFSVGKQLVALASLPIAAAIGIPATSYAAETSTDAPIVAAPDFPEQPVLIDLGGDLAALVADVAVTWSDAPSARTAAADAGVIDAELECMAKVVVHEAGNQPRRGQLAVAQLIMNRIESGRFADTICGVANQPGQFFQLSSFKPRRDTAQWRSAVEVSREARDRRSDEVVPGALFFHAAYASASNFFRSRQRVTTLGDHVFYR